MENNAKNRLISRICRKTTATWNEIRFVINWYCVRVGQQDRLFDDVHTPETGRFVCSGK